MEYTPSQQKAIDLVSDYGADNRRLFILWYGGIRAGKTYGMVRAGIEHSLTRENSNYIVAGYVLRSLLNNVSPYFSEICKEMDLKFKLVSGGVNPRIEIGTNKFLFYGGDRAGRSNNVQGATAVGLLIDEFELLDRDFVKQCEARISKAGALRIYTSNKGQPYSWAKKEYFDRANSGEIDAIVIDSNPDENTFVKEDFWDEKNSEFDEYYRTRFIENKFALLMEPLYTPKRQELDASFVLDMSTIYSYGKDHFTIPIYKSIRDKFLIGEIQHKEFPISVHEIPQIGLVLVNSTASRLAKELIKKRFTVRGYNDLFHPHKAEICQRAFGFNRVGVLEDAKETIEHLDRYAIPGMTENPAVSAIESTVEYLARVHRWE